MSGRASTAWLAASTLVWFVSAGLTSCEKIEGCEYTGSCPGDVLGGAGAESSGGAGADANAGAGADANTGAGGEAVSGGGEGGSGDAAPCDGECAEPTPICDATSDTCVECAEDAHCADATPVCDTETKACVACTDDEHCSGETPFCDPEDRHCVACLGAAECTDPEAAKCASGTCSACTRDADCAHLEGKPVCDEGTCVECTPFDEAACGENSCHPVNRRCTRTRRASVGLCRPCVADSECMDGTLEDPLVRCVPMEFQGTRRPTGFCLRRFSKACSPPFSQMPAPIESLSGAQAETYCGVDPLSTRCEAVLDLIDARRCAGGADSLCGCARDASDHCVGSGAGGLCRTVAGVEESCTIACGRLSDCPLGTECTLELPYCH